MTVVFWVREELTAQDKRRATPIIKKWLGSFYEEHDTDWGRFFEKYQDIFWKTRPPKPSVIYRCPRGEDETGEYDRWTSWSYDRDISFGAGPRCDRRRIQAMVHPDDIEVVLPAFGERIYPEGMAEVILRPGTYLAVPAVSFDDLSRYPPLTPPNYPSEG